MNAPALTPTPPCPTWCDPRYCQVTTSDVWHRGTPTRVETLDATYELSWNKADELAYPGEWGGTPELTLYIESKTLAAAFGSDQPMAILTGITVTALPLITAAFAEQMALVRLPDGLVAA